VVPLGVILVGLGIADELFYGLRFRRFFDPLYPTRQHLPEPIKPVIGRVCAYVGLVLLLVAAVTSAL
jgi:hypothetical protein